MYVHLQSVCTCLHSFALSLHSFVQYRCAFSFVHICIYITYNRSAHVCTRFCRSSCSFACLHLAPPVSMYLCLSASGVTHFHLFLLGTTCFQHVPLVSVCLHLSGVYLVSLHLAPLVCARLHLSASGITHFHLFLLGATCFCLPALVCCVFN